MKEYKIGIIGLGYVGLPLAVAFAEKYKTIGFDINANRIGELAKGVDSTLEIEGEYLKSVLVENNFKKKTAEYGFFPSDSLEELADCNFYIITVPTPTDKNNRPVLTPLIKASETVGKVLKKGDIVVYESTVYPGATEEDCIPILESVSKLKFNEDFFVGYSPERINPGDKEHTVKKIKKVTSGSTKEIGVEIDQLYKSIITAGTHLAPSIKVAEAAKIIENSQRDINIAFVNELSKIFRLLDIDTNEILEAAGTKWNFLPFKPGLVGGHCIGVDPYYLAQKAQEVGYNSEIILAGRRLNDSMGKYVADEMIKLLIRNDLKIKNLKIMILGFTFKENCPDIRNTKVLDVYNELISFGVAVDVYDPEANQVEVKEAHNIVLKSKILGKYDGIILAVPHNKFKNLNINSLKSNDQSPVFDLKGFLPAEEVDLRL